MKKAVFAILLLCAAVGAQSPLSLRYPLGIPDNAVSGVAAAMAGSGTAVVDEYLGTSLNPANAAIGERSAFSALVSFSMVNISDDSGSSSVSGYMPKLISLIIPIGRAGNIAFSMQQRYDANLNYYTTNTEKLGNATITNRVELQNIGGLTAWQGGWAFRFKNGWSLGLLYERLFYNMNSSDAFESTLAYELNEGAPSFTSRTYGEIASNFASDGIRFGTQLPLHEKVTFGAAVEYIFPGSDNGAMTRIYHTSSADTTERNYSVNLPPSINAGVAYRPNDRWLVALDFLNVTLWEGYENSAEPRAAQTTYGVSAGACFVPAANVLSSAYWEKIRYSAGLRYATLPHDGPAAGGAQEYSISIGAGLPIPNESGVVDLVFDIGRRTDARFEGYAENIIKFQLGINGGRRCFQKEKSRNY
jgi:hypothetical protein